MVNLIGKRSGRTRDVVLVVDDSPDTLRMLTDAIEDARMTVLVALDGAQALTMIEKVVPDVILMDAVMPGMDGFETCRRLKRHAAVSHVPVIFMTGLSETEHIVEALDAGGVDYVTKPIVPDELPARIRVHLANARRAHSAHAALDASGRFLMATDQSGRMLWATPQAAKLLGSAHAGFSRKASCCPPMPATGCATASAARPAQETTSSCCRPTACTRSCSSPTSARSRPTRSCCA